MLALLHQDTTQLVDDSDPTKALFKAVGYHRKGYPNQSNKKRKKYTNYNYQGTGPSSFNPPDPLGLWTRVSTRSTPQGLGREFRLARPRRASDASSDSSDPAGPRTRVPTRPTPQGLERRFRLAQPLLGSGARSRSTRSTRLPPYGARTREVTSAMTPIP